MHIGRQVQVDRMVTAICQGLLQSFLTKDVCHIMADRGVQNASVLPRTIQCTKNTS